MGDHYICSKCSGSMEIGWLIDRGHYRLDSLHWVKGSPEAALLSGVKEPKNPLPVIAYCCVACGYVEMYVPPH